jgi:uncharacterized protein (TIGR03118 family)
MGGLLVASLLGTTASGGSPAYVETDLVVNKLVNGVPTLTDSNGIVHVAQFFDPNLVNPWGVGESPGLRGSPFWVSDNGSSVSTLYNTAGTPQTLVVAIPAPGDPLGASGKPTGLVFNLAGGAAGQFELSGFNANGDATTAPAVFLFAAEDGTILGWNPGVNPDGTPAATLGKHAIIAVDNSPLGAIYKGLAIAQDSTGDVFLYATNFGAGTVEVYNGLFAPASGLPADAFVDPQLPRGYAPFNIVPISVGGSTKLFVTYALKEEGGVDDVAGQGHGIVDTYDLQGHLLARFAQHGQLDSPWGVALAPAGFGEFGGDVLIGNFGNGHINAFDPATGEFRGKLKDAHGQAVVIDGLWTIMFGNGGNGGDPGTLYFTAGPNDESDGIFGKLTPE